jgi:hypothetical protein
MPAGEPFLLLTGRLQNIDGVIHIRATQVAPLETPGLEGISVAGSYDFR